MPRYQSLIGVLGAMPVFESAARLRSFTKAAQELRLSQPAVSRRITALEERLELRLFDRNHNRLKLTPDGRKLLSAVETSLDQLDTVVTRLTRKPGRRKLTISCDFSIYSLWLQARLPRLRNLIDGIDFQLAASQTPDALDPETVDIRILWYDTPWPGREMHQLFADCASPVCSPAFAEREGLPLSEDLPAERFLDMPLLLAQSGKDDRLDWEDWFQAQGLNFTSGDRHYTYDIYQIAIHAAIEGEGVALGYSGLIDDALKSGALIKIGQSIDMRSATTFIEFEPNRISAVRRKKILGWFQSEAV